ncbi:MAG: pilus assembly protein [Methylovulum sp.]|jgi:type IV pilus assembly protein PilX|nr:pilus assembly protein [Methylovulum sp.]
MVFNSAYQVVRKQSVAVGKQQGAVLAISLIMLLLLTLIGVSGSQLAGLEEKMAGNLNEKNIAFQAAEAALATVEDSLTAPPIFSDTGLGGFYTEASAVDLSRATLTQDEFWLTNPNVARLPLNTLSVPSAYFIIQELSSVCLGICQPGSPVNVNYYRVTVRASGHQANHSVILQSVFAVPAF